MAKYENVVFYMDTEFNGHGGELISLALVSPLGYEFYDVRIIPDPCDAWVKDHVVPVLKKHPARPLIFRQLLHQFLEHFDNPTIICDWHADAMHFCHQLEGPDYGSSLDYPFIMRVLNTPPNSIVSSVPHNALADAQALMHWHAVGRI